MAKFYRSRIVVILALVAAMAILSSCAYFPIRGGHGASQQDKVTPGVALVLPRSGNLGPISTKIIAGAKLAESNLNKNGKSITVKVIYTEGKWLQQLRSLPPQFAIVGGPLQEKVYDQLRASGETENRAVFTFMSKMRAGDEGNQAWRFFCSADDQIDALVRFLDDMGMHTVVAFAPNDTFATNMTNLLEQKLSAKGMTLVRGSYVNGGADSIKASAAVLFNGNSGIEAVFLPDSWKNIPNVADAIGKSGRTDVALMGTMLWDGNLNSRGTPLASKYPLAVFPSAFVREEAPAPLNSGSYDFWSALGYDFVRFAQRMAMTSPLSAQQISSRAGTASRMTFAMAPVSYSSDGRASQKLFILQPGPSGATLLNKSSYQSIRQAAKTSAPAVEPEQQQTPQQGEVLEPGDYQESKQAASSGASDVKPSIAESSAQVPAPQQAAAPVPAAPGQPSVAKPAHTSYKLRLPTR